MQFLNELSCDEKLSGDFLYTYLHPHPREIS